MSFVFSFDLMMEETTRDEIATQKALYVLRFRAVMYAKTANNQPAWMRN
jgi:hypothetical protein